MSAYDELVADALGDDEGVNYSTEDGWSVCSVDRPRPEPLSLEVTERERVGDEVVLEIMGTFNLSEAAVREALAVAARAYACFGECDRRRPVTWAEWVGGRVVVHTCPGWRRAYERAYL